MSVYMRNMADITAAELKYSTRLVFGECGSWCRVSRCLGTPMVTLYRTEAEARERERTGKRCGSDCRGVQNHFTEYIEPLRDEVPVETGYHERIRA
jgi:hypothetical protein